MRNPEFTFRYKIRNWPEYNRTLVRRGQLTLWFDETAIACPFYKFHPVSVLKWLSRELPGYGLLSGL